MKCKYQNYEEPILAKGKVGEPSNQTMKKGKDTTREKQEITTTMEPLSPISQLSISPSLNCVIIFTLGFQTRCNPFTIVEGIKNTWIKLPRFTSKVEIKKSGKAIWIPVSVRVEDHVIVPHLDESTFNNPDQFIEDYTSNMANTPMNMSKPLWEVHILNIKTSNSESLCIGKIHHSLGDGLSLMSLLLASSRKISDAEALPTTAATRSKLVDSKSGSWWFIGRFWLMIRIIFTTVIELFKYFLTLLFLRDTKTPLVGKTGDKMRSIKVIHRIISFDDVKLVKNSMKMKVNDVFLGMTQAGLSRYLRRQYDKNLVVEKKNIRLRGTIAVNLRAYTKIEDLANMMAKGSKHRWGNFVGNVMFPLWIKSEDDPLEYVRRAKSTMDIKKLSMESLFCYGFIKSAIKVLGEKVVERIAKRLFDHTTLSFSNVMGPDEEISFFEHPMSYVTATAFGGPHALAIHYVSYVNKVIINLAVDTTVIPDPHQLCDDLVESLDIIKFALLEKEVQKMEV